MTPYYNLENPKPPFCFNLLILIGYVFDNTVTHTVYDCPRLAGVETGPFFQGLEFALRFFERIACFLWAKEQKRERARKQIAHNCSLK